MDDASEETLDDGIVACEVCLKEIPRSVGQSEEAVDYVYYFCGPSCYERWKAEPEAQSTVRTIGVTVTGRALDRDAACVLAEALASGRGGPARPIACYERRPWEVPAAAVAPRSDWLEQVEHTGANLKVDLNHGEYIFVFAAP
jgi:YHS domain-containing protein